VIVEVSNEAILLMDEKPERLRVLRQKSQVEVGQLIRDCVRIAGIAYIITLYPKVIYNIHPINHRQAFPALTSDSLLAPGPTDDPIRVEAFRSTFFLSPLPFSGMTLALVLSPNTFPLEAAESLSR